VYPKTKIQKNILMWKRYLLKKQELKKQRKISKIGDNEKKIIKKYD
jgi:hypothetical protein